MFCIEKYCLIYSIHFHLSKIHWRMSDKCLFVQWHKPDNWLQSLWYTEAMLSPRTCSHHIEYMYHMHWSYVKWSGNLVAWVDMIDHWSWDHNHLSTIGICLKLDQQLDNKECLMTVVFMSMCLHSNKKQRYKGHRRPDYYLRYIQCSLICFELRSSWYMTSLMVQDSSQFNSSNTLLKKHIKDSSWLAI